jgi:O-antigen ligase
MDILLYIGIVGLTIFLANVILMIVRTIRFAFHRRTLECFFPLVILFYAVVANITYSLFFELETFVWILMVASLFLATRPDSERQSPMP